MLGELIRAFFFIFVAEMGDKTQILAMAFATQFKVQKVLLGVLIGSALNHGIAIALGSYLSNVIPMNTVQIVAGILFIGFGLWALKSDDEEENNRNKNKFGPVITVALAFFIGELGDKTQLTAMTLATDAKYPLFILFGTVLGMIATSGIGIFVGSKIGEKVPESAIKITSSAVFLFFGTLKLFQTLPDQYLTSTNIILFFAVLLTIVYILLRPILAARKAEKRSPLKEVAATLYEQTHQLKEAVDNICLGESVCGSCEGKKCLIGFTRRALASATNEGVYILPNEWEELPKYTDKKFDKGKLVEALSMTIAHYIKYGFEEDKNYVVNKTREALETLVFGEIVPFDGDIKKYFKLIKRKNEIIGEKIINRVEEINKG
ncbi:TMEM165/GDT1 family protein [Brassicibacter mesophilus]|uniref:TMEM165/GDT1 family protein n=1 Tax=Brassicibacter mesophilus TaxID=745119 RepID=UPI003D2184FD